MPGIRKQAHPERVAPSAPGTPFGSWSFATRPAWRAKDEIRAPATLVEATFHATADAGSIPAVSIVIRNLAVDRFSQVGGCGSQLPRINSISGARQLVLRSCARSGTVTS